MINLITAMTYDGVIGIDNKLPWRIPEDLQYFKKVTENSVIIMGRKTWDSLPVKPLPNRENIIITNGLRGMGYIGDTHTCFCSLENALEVTKYRDKEIFIIGGAEIYKEFYKYCDKLFITYVYDNYEGNIYFPINREQIAKDFEIEDITYSNKCLFSIYKRRNYEN